MCTSPHAVRAPGIVPASPRSTRPRTADRARPPAHRPTAAECAAPSVPPTAMTPRTGRRPCPGDARTDGSGSMWRFPSGPVPGQASAGDRRGGRGHRGHAAGRGRGRGQGQAVSRRPASSIHRPGTGSAGELRLPAELEARIAADLGDWGSIDGSPRRDGVRHVLTRHAERTHRTSLVLPRRSIRRAPGPFWRPRQGAFSPHTAPRPRTMKPEVRAGSERTRGARPRSRNVTSRPAQSIDARVCQSYGPVRKTLHTLCGVYFLHSYPSRITLP